MRKSLWIILMVVMAAIWAPNAKAYSITFTDMTTGSGTIGGTAFSNSTITISGTADTASVTTFSGGYGVEDTSTSVSISGLGTYNFTTAVGFFVNNVGDVVGFQRAPSSADLIDGPVNSAFATWALNSSIGPITGVGKILQWDTIFIPAVETTDGQLILNNASPSITFSASVATPTPEPGTSGLMMIGVGLLGLVMVIGKRIAVCS